MPPAGTITSAANPLLKDVRRAIAQGGLTERGWCVAESFHLLAEAQRSGCELKMVLAAESAEASVRMQTHRPAVPLVLVPDALFQKVAATETTQGVIALVAPRVWKMAELFAGHALIVLLDGMQDPGNAGAIVRAAEAFGATGVLMLKGTASPYNPKTLRASAGSLFRLPFLHGVATEDALAALRARDVVLYAGVTGASVSPADVDLTAPCALAIGSEARGVSQALRAAARAISIPTAGVESLNAAVAAGILLYEARRQRTVRR